MRRDQLEHAIRTACQIVGRPEVVVVGSQAILGTFAEHELPPEATMSAEVDILPLVEDRTETARLAEVSALRLAQRPPGTPWGRATRHRRKPMLGVR